MVFSGGLIVLKIEKREYSYLKKLFAENHFDDDGGVIFFLPRDRERFGEKQIFFFGGIIEIFHYQMTCCFSFARRHD
jgi:hypothetical protein